MVSDFSKIKEARGIYPEALIYLIFCAVNKCKPDRAKLEGIDFAKLLKYAKSQTLAGLCACILDKSDIADSMDPEVAGALKQAKAKAIRKIMLLDSARAEILSFLEEQGIWYMPLKGIIIKNLYPEIGMREMADNDILYDVSGQKILQNFMTKHGYDAFGVGKGCHDVYKKEPVYNFEMHTRLYTEVHEKGWAEYFENVREKLQNVDGKQYELKFTEDDFYIFFVSHAFKHFNGGGTGLRTLADFYVYLTAKEEELNRQYLDAEFKKLRIDEFEAKMNTLCKKVFSANSHELNAEETEILIKMCGNGTYGSMDNRVENSLKKIEGNLQNSPSDNRNITSRSKRIYLLRRIFPDSGYYKSYYPFLYKHKWLIPFFIPFRAVRGMFTHGKTIIREFKAVQKK